MNTTLRIIGVAILFSVVGVLSAFGDPPVLNKTDAAAALTAYFEAMSVPKPFPVLTGEELAERQQELRNRILANVGLLPLPERVDLDIRRSEPIDHPWCVIEMIEYQLWPGVYTQALLVMPKEFRETPAPGVLCPHGHWSNDFAHPDVQKRLIILAKMGYVVLSPRQNHREELLLGLSHQTLMIWTNMRGIDVLQSLDQVDPERIGAAGASGGGLQTQMLAAVDDRVKAATIVGMTCDFREIMFPHAAHCGCNHWPNVLTFTDAPEISALVFPRPVQYLVMNDWTRHFPHDNFPIIQKLYRLNGIPEHVSCTYWPTGHIYDREKRERTYWWMERWLRNNGSHHTDIPHEPDEIGTVSPPELLDKWPVENPENQGFDALAMLFHEQYHYANQPQPVPKDRMLFQRKMREVLTELLGLERTLATGETGFRMLNVEQRDDVRIARALFPSEGGLELPATILWPANETTAPWPLFISLHRNGTNGIDDLAPHLEKARRGNVVVIADIRFAGIYDLPGLAGIMGPDLTRFEVASPMSAYARPEDQHKYLLWAWERNSVVWGRPLIGMAVTDIQRIVAALEQDDRVNASQIQIQTSDTAHLALAAVFTAILDERIVSLNIDFRNHRYDAYRYWYETPEGLPVIPFILRYGDIPQWLAVIADRDIIVRNLKATDEEQRWLHRFFAAAANPNGLQLELK